MTVNKIILLRTKIFCEDCQMEELFFSQIFCFTIGGVLKKISSIEINNGNIGIKL